MRKLLTGRGGGWGEEKQGKGCVPAPAIPISEEVTSRLALPETSRSCAKGRHRVRVAASSREGLCLSKGRAVSLPLECGFQRQGCMLEDPNNLETCVAQRQPARLAQQRLE